MSLSTLGAQLAALNNNNQGKQALPTSRRHEDAIGRGVSHSVQTGHAHFGKGHLYKASVLYEDAKKASDVPLATIQENCITSLRELETLDPVFGDFVESLCTNSAERGMNTYDQNASIDESIIDLLHRMALRMDTSKRVTAACLHIIEFLLRRHDLHIRPKLVSCALLVLLPHHEQPYFLRFIQLVDLASLPTYSWLRPYTIPKARVGRDLIAKHVAKNVALLRDVLNLVSKAAKLPKRETTMAFCAAVVVQAMTLQQRNTGSIEEMACQAIIPIVVKSCRGRQGGDTSSAYRNFGYVMASTLAETGNLAEEPRHLLVSSILQGLAENGTDSTALDNGLVVSLTLLQPSKPSNKRNSSFQLSVGDGMNFGYSINKSILLSLSKLEGITDRFGHLFAVEGFVEFAHWIASIWVVGWRRLQKTTKKDNKGDGNAKNSRLEGLLQGLLEDPNLTSRLWNKEWIEELTCFILTESAIAQSTSQTDDAFLSSILDILKRKDGVAQERGITRALIRLKRDNRVRVATWLGLTTLNSDKKKKNSESDVQVQLPARVALEHADVEVRLDAIKRLCKEAEEQTSMEVDGGETILECFLRRLLSDDNIEVVFETSKALHQLMKLTKTDAATSRELASGALEVLYVWSGRSVLDKTLKISLTQQLIRLLSVSFADVETDSVQFARLLEGIAANLSHPDQSLAETASEAILVMLNGKKNRGKLKEARRLLFSDVSHVRHFARSLGGNSKAETRARRRFFSFSLSALAEFPPSVASSTDTLLEFCFWGTDSFGSDMTSNEISLLGSILRRSTMWANLGVESLMTFIFKVAELPGPIFEEIGALVVAEMCSNTRTLAGNQVPSIAILMEATLNATSTEAAERLMDIAANGVRTDAMSSHLAFIPALALTCVSENRINKRAVALLGSIGEALTKAEGEWTCLIDICNIVSDKATAILGSISFLNPIFTASLQRKKGSGSLLETILKLAFCTVVKVIAPESNNPTIEHSWLWPSRAKGGLEAALTVSKAVEAAGEEMAPLSLRWTHFGKPVLDFLLANDATEEKSDHLSDLLEHATMMLKGYKAGNSHDVADNGGSTIITSGPGRRGGRRRSYSFGKSEASSFLHPYPKDMTLLIDTLFSGGTGGIRRQAREFVCIQTLCSESWGNNVFGQLSSVTKQKITIVVLNAAIGSLAESADDAFFALPLSCSDLVALFGKLKKEADYLSSTAYIADYMKSNANRLLSEADSENCLASAFQAVVGLSTKHLDEDDSVDYVRDSLLNAIVEFLATVSSTSRPFELNKEASFKTWIKMLVGIIGGSTSKQTYRVAVTARSKRITLSVLTLLCKIYPREATNELIPAVVSLVSSADSDREASLVGEFLSSTVPVYIVNTKVAKLSPISLIHSFIAASNKNTGDAARLLLYQGFADALSKADVPLQDDFYIGTFMATCLASDLYFSKQSKTSPSTGLSTQVMSHIAVSTRVPAILTLVTYVRILSLEFGGMQVENEPMLKSLEAVSEAAEFGPGSGLKKKQSRDETKKQLCSALMFAVRESVASPGFCRFLRHTKGQSSPLILRLWQDLLVIQSVDNSQIGTALGKDRDYWSSIAEMTNETLDCIQRHLPSHIFLAFSTSLIRDSDSEELRARALQLVGDRSLNVESSDAEAALYRDMLPFLASLLQKDCGLVVNQALLVAIEHIARHLCSSSDGRFAKYLDIVVSATSRASFFIESYESQISLGKASFSELDSASKQLLSTATLCAATTIQVCGPRVLPILPKLMVPSLKLLGLLNESMEKGNAMDAHVTAQTKLLQISILRLNSSVVDKLPQFVSPYLGALLAPAVLPSSSLRDDSDDQGVEILAATNALCARIAANVPVRQLFPQIASTLLALDASSASSCLLSIMALSIQASTGKELGPQLDTIVKCATHVLDASVGQYSEDESLNSVNEMFLALVMKLSEVQFRSLYAMLRSWRGDLETENPSHLVQRRYGFWSLSATMGSNLKSIFLPCLTTVFSDAIEELNLATAVLSKRKAVKKAGGKKKQRIDEENADVDYDDGSLLSLKHLLKCLEVSLQADAHSGGSWARENDAQRFNSLLEPLGKLLQCQLSSRPTKTHSFHSLVQGESDDDGNVVDCLVALSSAAGDEQLWKPLNHAVVQACSHETRSEVRKAGVKCLASIIRSVGEEYMVLIPECLPVLSELLEESDEEIAALAQECISMSEELLGESLEENLR